VPSGLTSTEQKQLRDIQAQDDERPIPWTFVGHHTPERVALVDHLLRFVDTRGFVYLPGLAPYTETGSPHLNQEQLETVLRKTRYQVWCSHHNFFYMEPERFRLSLLTGSVPVKVVASKAGVPEDMPFPYLVMRWQEVPDRLRGEVFTEVRRRFQDDFTRLPTLTEGLARFLVQAGVLSGDNLNHVLDPARQPRGLAA
jgi:hypothetical protein